MKIEPVDTITLNTDQDKEKHTRKYRPCNKKKFEALFNKECEKLKAKSVVGNYERKVY